METKWQNRHAFAEYAEALGIPTIDVIAAWQTDGPLTVLFTRGIEEIKDDTEAMRDTTVYEQAFQRDADQLLVKFGEEVVAGTGRDFFGI